MCKVAKITPLALLLMLLACAKTDPVDEDAVTPPDSLAGDISAIGLAAPATAATAEAVQAGGLAATRRRPGLDLSPAGQ